MPSWTVDCHDDAIKSVPQQPTARQLMRAGWVAAPTATPGSQVVHRYLDAAARLVVWEASAKPTAAELTHCEGQIAADVGLTQAMGRPLLAWRLSGSERVTLYTFAGRDGRVAFGLVRDGIHTYLAVPCGHSSPQGLKSLLADYHEVMDVPSGAQSAAIGYDGTTNWGVDLITWQADRPPLH